MSRLRRIGSGAAILAGSQVVAQASVFLRNVVVVRALTPGDFGIAATFAIVLTLLETVSNLSVETLVVQSKEGEEPVFQRTVQCIRATQGLVLGVLLFVCAPWIAGLFQTGEALWCYQVLALAAVAKGLMHFDPHRYIRRSRFGPDAFTNAGAEVVGLVFVVVASWFVKDYTLVLWALVLRYVAYTGLTHLAAERDYRWSFDRAIVGRIASFGWPLLLGSMLLYVVLQGDRLLVGSASTLSDACIALFGADWRPDHVFDKTDLAAFAVAVGLTLMPSAFIEQVLGNLIFPALARQQDNRERFERVYVTGAMANAAVGTAVAIFFIFAGGTVVAFIYGEPYRRVGDFIGWLAAIQALRALRGSLQGGSLALGDSRVPLIALVARAAVFPVAIWVTVSGGSLTQLAVVGVLGEGLALVAAWTAFGIRSRMHYRYTTPAIAYAGAIFGMASLVQSTWDIRSDGALFTVGLGAAAVTPALALVASATLREELGSLFGRPTTGQRAT